MNREDHLSVLYAKVIKTFLILIYNYVNFLIYNYSSFGFMFKQTKSLKQSGLKAHFYKSETLVYIYTKASPASRNSFSHMCINAGNDLLA